MPDDWTRRAPCFTRHGDGRITIDAWPERIAVSDALLAAVDEPRILTGEGLPRVEVDNGRALYRQTLRLDAAGWSDYQLVRGTIEP